MVTPQFVGVADGSRLNLQTLVPTGDNTSDNVQIQTLDFAGRTVDAYDWNDWAAATPCWVDADWNPIEGVNVEPGQGFWVMGTSSEQALQSAGSVGTKDVVVSLRVGATATGNPFPVALDLQDILPEGEDVADNVQIQTLDFAGRTVDAYDWNDWAAATPCWVDADWNPIEGVTIAPGQGLWVMGSSDAQSLRFPAPEL